MKLVKLPLKLLALPIILILMAVVLLVKLVTNLSAYVMGPLMLFILGCGIYSACTADVDFGGNSGRSGNSVCSRHVLCRSDRNHTGRDEGFSGGLCTFIK